MYRVFDGKPAGWRPLERPKDIKMGVKEMGWGSWTIHVAQDMAKNGAVLHTVMNLQFCKMLGIL